MWEKEKLLVTSNFFFSHSVFKRLVQQTHKNQGLFGKGLIGFSSGVWLSHERALQSLSVVLVKHRKYLTLFQTTNFRLFQNESLCSQQFQIWWNGRKFSKRVENTVGKGEIACYEQYLIFPQCFQNTCTADTKIQGLALERVKYLRCSYDATKIMIKVAQINVFSFNLPNWKKLKRINVDQWYSFWKHSKYSVKRKEKLDTSTFSFSHNVF